MHRAYMHTILRGTTEAGEGGVGMLELRFRGY